MNKAAHAKYMAELYRLETGHRRRSVTEVVVISTIWGVIAGVGLLVLGGSFWMTVTIVRHFWP